MNKMNSLKKVSQYMLATSLLIGTQQVSAQAVDTSKTYDLKGVTITATRDTKKVIDVGRSVTVITEEDIQSSIYNNVAELLSEQEGIYIVGTGQAQGAIQGVFLRGANKEHTVIIIDGVRITDPSSVENGINLSELSLANIEKIEVVRGSHSTLYGSSAIGGIINIVTKKSTKPGFHLNAETKTGIYNEALDLSENLQLSYTTESGFYLSGEVYNTNVSGMDATMDTVTDPTVFNKRDKDNFDKLDVVGKAGFKNDKWDIFGSYKVTDQLLDIDDGAYNDDDNYTVGFNRNLASYQASYKVNEKMKLKFLGGYTNMIRIAIDDSSVVDELGNFDNSYFEGKYEGSVLNNELQANFKLKHVNIVLGGGNFKETMTFKTLFINTAWAYKSEDDLDSLNIEAITNSGYAHIELNGGMINEKWNRLNLTVGGRFNNHSSFGNYVTYEINPSYKVGKNALLYGSFSTGFNAPALYRLFNPSENYISGITRGNLDLNPETSVSYELGIKQQVNDKVSFSVAIFQTEVSDLLEYVYLWDKSIGIDTLGNDWMRDDYRGDTYLNIGTQTNKGVEFTIHSKLNDHFTLSGNLSLVSGKLNYQPENNDLKDDYHVQLYTSGDFLNKEVEILKLVRRSNTANIGLSYQATKKLILRTNVRYVDGRNDIFYDGSLGPYGALNQTGIEDYTLVGLTAKYQFNKNFAVTVKSDNLFNVDYREINGYSTKGRSLYLKLRYAF